MAINSNFYDCCKAAKETIASANPQTNGKTQTIRLDEDFTIFFTKFTHHTAVEVQVNRKSIEQKKINFITETFSDFSRKITIIERFIFKNPQNSK